MTFERTKRVSQSDYRAGFVDKNVISWNKDLRSQVIWLHKKVSDFSTF